MDSDQETRYISRKITSFRPPILSPRGHKDYNRLKYYSALKTGFKHMHKEDVLNIPKHMIDE